MEKEFHFFCPGQDHYNSKPLVGFARFSTLEELEHAVRSLPEFQLYGNVGVLLDDPSGIPMNIRSHTSLPSSIPLLDVRVFPGQHISFLPAPHLHPSPFAHVNHLLDRTQVFARACWSLLPHPPTPLFQIIQVCNLWVLQNQHLGTAGEATTSALSPSDPSMNCLGAAQR